MVKPSQIHELLADLYSKKIIPIQSETINFGIGLKGSCMYISLNVPKKKGVLSTSFTFSFSQNEDTIKEIAEAGNEKSYLENQVLKGYNYSKVLDCTEKSPGCYVLKLEQDESLDNSLVLLKKLDMGSKDYHSWTLNIRCDGHQLYVYPSMSGPKKSVIRSFFKYSDAESNEDVNKKAKHMETLAEIAMFRLKQNNLYQTAACET